MKRCLLTCLLLMLLAASHSFAQSPRFPATAAEADRGPAATDREDPPVRRRLAEPLRNQFDRFRQPQQNDFIDAEEVTPEMWLYMQEMRRYDDPLQAVRRNAATRAAHRRARLAALQWFGFSNIRPHASPIPFSDVYSPMWISNSWNPYEWTGAGHSWSAVRVEPIVITR